MTKVRKIAVNRLKIGNRIMNGPVVLEISENKVIDYYLLHNECANTEWLGGTAMIKICNGSMYSYINSHLIYSE